VFNITTVAFSDSRGGAAIAALQQVQSMRADSDIEIDFVVAEKNLEGSISLGPNKMQKLSHLILRVASYLLTRLQITSNTSKHSLNLFSSLHVLNYCKKERDCIHLHWFNNDTLSIRALESLLKHTSSLIVITLHDEWFFAGSEHSMEMGSKRYLTSYNSNNCNVKGFDLNSWTFKRKLRLCKLFEQKNVVFTAPSTYLKKKAKSSFLLKNANVVKIPNIIDCLTFQDKNKRVSRDTLKLPQEKLIVLFGAIGGASYLKGSDLLLSALERMKQVTPDIAITLLTFGGSVANKETISGYETINLGHISSKDTLANVYSSADVTIVPSRLEAFGQVAAESLACATPVIAFNNSGLTDIVQHGKSGLLVEAFEIEDLANAIVKILSMPISDRVTMGEVGRNFIQEKFRLNVVVKEWKQIYKIN
jgi:glycosyltransferase involved in cell wall biosynthesis